MTAFTALPDRFAWSARELADAVPRRLSDDDAFALPVACALPARRAARRSFLPAAHPALFRVRG